MTREDLSNIFNKYKDDDVLNLGVLKEYVNAVYDDFESRTCENCKYYIEGLQLFGGSRFICMNEEVGDIMYDHFSKDFGCNKFKRKQDE